MLASANLCTGLSAPAPLLCLHRQQPINPMTSSLLPALTSLQDDIAQRVDSIRSTQPKWPCRMGCDRCCHRLAEIPQLTLAEWELLRSGLMTLPKDLLQTILQDIRLLNKISTIFDIDFLFELTFSFEKHI